MGVLFSKGDVPLPTINILFQVLPVGLMAAFQGDTRHLTYWEGDHIVPRVNFTYSCAGESPTQEEKGERH